MPDVQHKRGTRADLNTLAAADGLLIGQIYVITDEDRLAVAKTIGTYQATAKEDEGGPQFITLIKSTDEERVSSDAYTTDADIVSPTLDANSFYRFEMMLLFTAGTVEDMKFQVERTGLADADLRYARDLDNAAAVTYGFDSSITCAGGGFSSFRMGNYIGVLRTGASTGTVRLGWGQDTSGQGITTIRAGSMMMLRKVS